MAGYEMTHTEFAMEVGIVPRTLERRLKTGKFLAEEVARCARVMSEISGDQVSIADLHAGRISVFGGTPTGKGTVHCLKPYLTGLTGGGLNTAPVRPPLKLVSDAA
jgi:hypothetical protein